MRHSRIGVLSVCLLMGSPEIHADKKAVDCSKDSLANAVSKVKANDQTIAFTGICAGPIVIRTDGLTLQGVGAAVIDGGGQDAVTVAGAGRVTLADFDVRNGRSGIVGLNGAHLTLSGVSSHDNLVFGITLQNASSAALANVSTTDNELHGLDVQTGSAADRDRYPHGVHQSRVRHQCQRKLHHLLAGNGGCRQQCAGHSDCDQRQRVHQQFGHRDQRKQQSQHWPDRCVRRPPGCVRGLNQCLGNPDAGVSVNSKAGLDLDAGATLTSANNGSGVLIEETSVMTVFNTPEFSGVPGSVPSTRITIRTRAFES